jgi:hypothetical protein
MVSDTPAYIIASDRQKSLKRVITMMPDPVVLAAAIILLFPMGFFLMSAPAFLLVKLDIPEVTQLLRGLFSAYFLMVSIAGAVGTVAFAVTGRLAFAIGIGLIVAFAIWARRWFLRQMDAELRARDAGDAGAVRRLRRLHWGGMLCNAVQLALVVVSIPYLSVPPT